MHALVIVIVYGREMEHTTVLSSEISTLIKRFAINALCIDATLGDGGHALQMVSANSDVQVIGIDRDEHMLARAKKRMSAYHNRVTFIADWFDNFFATYNGASPQLVLFDLGMSQPHLHDSGRGFTFSQDEPLDMRYTTNQPLTATAVVNRYSERHLAQIFFDYGEERFARQIAAAIVRFRAKQQITRTSQLNEIVLKAFPKSYTINYRRHPATRIYQALRIVVNDELSRLKRALPLALEKIAHGGLLAVITFHSLEDRIVKHFFKMPRNHMQITHYTKKPIIPTRDEIAHNNAARSAKLRAIIKHTLHSVANGRQGMRSAYAV